MNSEEEKINLNAEQEAALKLMLSGRNVFLTGEAGTGKSTLVREFINRCGRECIVLAPTGIAALNAGGTTLHSQLMLKPGLLDPTALEPLTDGGRCQVIRAAKTVIVDEISMVRSDLFCALDARLRKIGAGANREKPFGGRQIVLVGDFFQLPPVLKDEVERRFIDEGLGGVYAFQTDLWVAAMFKTISLKTVHRQSGDVVFRNVLNNLRQGAFERAAKVLNSNCQGEKRFASPPVCLCTTNREAKYINDIERAKVRGVARTFRAEVTGRFAEADYPADAELDLSIGVRVMVICNQRTDGVLECVNGDMGVVSAFGSDDANEVTVKLDNGKSVILEPHTWEKYAYKAIEEPIKHTQEMKKVVTGSFTQIPLKLGYAITIHKSQGLSLDCVDLRLGRGCFDHGQLYTALSRCRSLAGLRIDRPLIASDLIVDPVVIDFCAKVDSEAAKEGPDDAVWYEEAMQYYLRRLKTGSGEIPPGAMRQFEFDFSPRVHDHPALSKLRRLCDEHLINKYDAPVLNPLAAEVINGTGVKEDELEVISRIAAKYGS